MLSYSPPAQGTRFAPQKAFYTRYKVDPDISRAFSSLAHSPALERSPNRLSINDLPPEKTTKSQSSRPHILKTSEATGLKVRTVMMALACRISCGGQVRRFRSQTT